MFNALNRFISKLDAAPLDDQQSTGAAAAAYGFQVLRNGNAEVPLEPWFDFIIGVNGRTIDNPDPALFATEVRNCAGTSVSFGIFGGKGQKIREVYINIPAGGTVLNMTLQWSPLALSEDVWHILDVIPNSPADVAGLLPYGDYVIGSPEGQVRGESGLGELVEDFLNRPLGLYVYNHEYNVTRPVTITPTRSWGGEGALGCVLGFGALHRIPPSLDEPPQAPGETLFSTDSRYTSLDEKQPLISTPDPSGQSQGGAGIGSQFLIPADMALPAASGSPVGNMAPKRRGRVHAVASPAVGSGLDDYFKEGEQKSLKEDHAPKKSGSRVAPPPKAEGLAKGAVHDALGGRAESVAGEAAREEKEEEKEEEEEQRSSG